MSGSAVRAGRSFIEVFLKDRVTADLRAMTTRLRAMSGVLARTGGVAFGAGTAMVAAFLRPLGAASDLQEIMSKFDTVFGDNSQAVKQWGDQFAGQVGRSKQQVAEFLAGSQDLFVPLGFDEASATALSKTITGLSIDLASFNNGTDSDALRDLHAALTGSGEVMKKYGVIVSEAAVKQELLSQGIKATDATEQQKVMARLSIIMRGITAAQGDAIKTAGSWANQNKRIEGAIKDVSAAIGSVLIPLLSPYQTMVGDIIAGAEGWIEKNRFLVVGVAAVAAGLLVGGAALLSLSAATYAASIAFSGLATITGLAGSAIGAATSLIRTLSGAMLVKRAASSAAAAAMIAYSASLTVARGILTGLAGTIGVARIAVAGLRLGFLATAATITVTTGAAGVLRGAWAGLRAATLGLAGAMSFVRGISLTTSGALAFMSIVANGGAGAMALLSGALAAVQAAALGPLAPIAMVAAGVVGLGAVLYMNRETVFDFLGNSLDTLQGTLSDVWGAFAAFGDGVSTWFSGVATQASFAWSGISAAIAVGDLATAWEIAWSTMKIVALQTFLPIMEAWSELKTIAGFVISELKAAWSAVMEGLVAAVAPLQSAWSTFTGSVSQASSAVAPLALTWNEFTTGIVSAFDGAIVAIRVAWKSAATFIAQTMFSVLGAIQSTLDRIAEFDPTGAAARLRGLLDVDTAGIIAMLDEDNDRFAGGLTAGKADRDDDRAEKMAQREAERESRLQVLREKHASALAELEKTRADAMTKSLAKKAEQDSKMESPAVADEDEFDIKKLFAEAMAGLKETERGSSGGSSPDIAGTFSSAALAIAAASGGSSVDQEQLRAQQEQLKKQDTLIKFTGDMARDLAAAWTVG